MRNLNPQRQLDILDKTYIKSGEIYELLPLSLKASRKLFKEIEQVLLSKQIPTIPGMIPTKYVLDIYPVDRKGLERAVKRKGDPQSHQVD